MEEVKPDPNVALLQEFANLSADIAKAQLRLNELGRQIAEKMKEKQGE